MNRRSLLVGIWIIFLVIATSQLVSVAANLGVLIWGAPILPVIPICGLFWLKPKEELAGWSLFTVWLASTYISTGIILEYVAFAVIVAMSIAGYFRSPWFFVLAWFGHIGWDFIPRDLPQLFQDLPIACLIFDGLIGVYLVWQQLKGRWLSDAQLIEMMSGNH